MSTNERIAHAIAETTGWSNFSVNVHHQVEVTRRGDHPVGIYPGIDIPLPAYSFACIQCKRCQSRFWGFGFHWMEFPSNRWARYACHYLIKHSPTRDPAAWPERNA